MSVRKKCRKWFRTPSFSNILEVLQDFYSSFGSRNSPTTSILHTICHVYRSVWPAREAKPCFSAMLEHSVLDCETHLQKAYCLLKKAGTLKTIWAVQEKRATKGLGLFDLIQMRIAQLALVELRQSKQTSGYY